MASRSPAKQYKPIIDPRKHSEVSPEQAIAERYATGREKTSTDIDLIKQCLKYHHVFSSLEEYEIEVIMQDLVHFNVPAGTNLFEQNKPGLFFFIVASGFLQVMVGSKVVNMLTTGEGFGELALMHDSPRSATIRVKTTASLWGLSRGAFRQVTRKIQLTNYENMKKFLNGVPLLKNLGKQGVEAILHALTVLKFEPSQVIVREGDPGDTFYLITEGEVNATIEGKGKIRTMAVGDYFGEMALLFDSPRTATITAGTKVRCISLGRGEISDLFGEELQPILYRNSMKISMEKNPTLSALTKDQHQTITTLMHVQNFEAGQVVIARGTDLGAKLWIVLNGSLQMTRSGTVIEKNSCIAEQHMTAGQGHLLDDEIKAVDDAVVAFITANDFEKAISGSFNQVTDGNNVNDVLRSVSIFRSLPDPILNRLAEGLVLQKYEDGQKIITTGEEGENFYIIKDGKVSVTKNGKQVRTLAKLDYFGERALITSQPRSMTITSQDFTECWVLNKVTFLEIVNSYGSKSFMHRMSMQDLKLNLNEIHIVKTLGNGSFGDVYLAVGNQPDHLFALKSIQKNKIVQHRLFDSINLERSLLLEMNHEMIIGLFNTYKNENYVFLLTEYVRGMDLFDAIRELDLLEDDAAKFYTIGLMCILEYMHDRGIIYRDLKPENVMIDHEGYPKLIDFGTAKFIKGRTFTIVGTPHYMAPDTISGKGYGFSADYWSLGVILYEFMCGGLPFGNDESDPYMVYDCVLQERLQFPTWLGHTFPAKGFIERLLDRNSVMRTGGKKGPLKSEPWLANVNWNDLMSKQLTPPFIPPTELPTREIEAALKKNEPADRELASKNRREPSLRAPAAHANWDQDF